MAAAGRRLTWLDVFAGQVLEGNQLAVVHDADDLDDATMQRFARETNLSETTFVQAPTAAGADYRNRIFTPLRELPFAGHPSLGTAVAVAHAEGRAQAGYVQQTEAGLQPVDVELAGRQGRASMLQEPAAFGASVEDPSDVLAAIGLGAGDAHPELPVQAVSCGVWHLLVPLRDAGALGRTTPDIDRLRTVTEATGTVTLYPFVVGEDGAARARAYFEDPAGAREDPATGSAAGPLCAYLRRHLGTERIVVSQGVELGRPSRMDAAMEGGRPRVSGDVVIVADGTLHL